MTRGQGQYEAVLQGNTAFSLIAMAIKYFLEKAIVFMARSSDELERHLLKTVQGQPVTPVPLLFFSINAHH
jgi:hypothetical protein